MDRAVTLAEAERVLRLYFPSQFDTSAVAYPECIEAVRNVEDDEAWREGYPSLDAFYDTHEDKHPAISLYGIDRRRIEKADRLTDPSEKPTQRLEHLRQELESG
jgi:hypothetical protein